MKDILISIKPKFVDQIQKGIKKIEYRKVVFKDRDIKKMYIYSSAPIQKVVAVCEISKILCSTPEEIWLSTSSASGISKDFFDLYFKDRSKAYAIEMKSIHFFDQPMSLSDLGVLRAPQSYQYIRDQIQADNATAL